MNILLLGSGGREHAMAWKMLQSKLCRELFIAPGNPGTATCGTNVSLSVNDFKAIGKFCLEKNIELLVVGPEDPLVNGITDYFLADDSLKKIPVIGPDKTGAQLEGSKLFAKKFMQKYSIPTAAYKSFTKNELADAIKFLDTFSPPYVLKADGLAAGKGVVIAQTKQEAVDTLNEMLVQSKFGVAGTTVVIEQFLSGIEVSVFIITDGISYKILPEAKDYKRIGENDTGLNTGGMGAVSPVPFADEDFMRKVEERIIKPTILGLHKEKINYQGFIFFGLMASPPSPLSKGRGGDSSPYPYVIEYNCRMGDPETEVVMPRIKSDLVEIFLAVAEQKLSQVVFETENYFASTVVVVSGGYPDNYEKGKIIIGMEDAKDVLVFHAGTSRNADGKLITSGGRVLAATATGNNLKESLGKCYSKINKIQFENSYYRKDIGKDLQLLLQE
ncbi:MAG TPA: phosphoribosylamine--glycine ligase [Bacteroidia bacterium]|nr:phosphoribosylamine--glycine ligase [Bacteroidia bacterium]